jgi:hypothetical protein
MHRSAPATVGLVLLSAPAAAVSPAELLAAVAANGRFPSSTRADVQIERRQDDKTTSTSAVIVGRGQTLYVETRDGLRALVRPNKIVVRANARVVPAAPGARLGASDLLLEDLVPVTPALLKVPQVSDEGPTGTVVTGAPAFPSARALIVLTIDPERSVVVRTKYYEKSISDLASFRRDEDFVEVAGHRRPTRIAVDRAREGASTSLRFAWRAAPESPPLLFSPRGLRAPSPIRW